MTGCHALFRRAFLCSWRESWLVSSVAILLSDPSLLCHVLCVHNCLFCNSAYLTENTNCSLGSQGVTRVRCYVQGDKIKLPFSLFCRVSIVTVVRYAFCSPHKYCTGIVLCVTTCTTLHAAQRSLLFSFAVRPASLAVARCIVFLRLAACVASNWINERPICIKQGDQQGVTNCGWPMQ